METSIGGSSKEKDVTIVGSNITLDTESKILGKMNNEDFVYPRIDSMTHTWQIIDYAHHEVHSGSHYYVKDVEELSVNNVLDMQWTSPNTETWAHFIFEISSESEVEWMIYEDATIISAGTAVPIINNNRNSSKTSGAIVTVQVNSNLTNANANTDVSGALSISHGIIGANKSSGQQNRANEIILKQGTTYCFRAIANGTGYLNYVMEWYEHTNREDDYSSSSSSSTSSSSSSGELDNSSSSSLDNNSSSSSEGYSNSTESSSEGYSNSTESSSSSSEGFTSSSSQSVDDNSSSSSSEGQSNSTESSSSSEGPVSESSSSEGNSSSSSSGSLPMIFEVRTNSAGPSSNTQFTFPLVTGETYDFTVLYEASSVTHTTDTDLTIQFSGVGVYSIEIYGTFPAIRFSGTTDKLKLQKIEQWGDIKWTTMEDAFFGCSAMQITATDEPDWSGITTMRNAFNDTNITSFPLYDTSTVTDFFGTFWGCGSMNTLALIDTSLGTTFESFLIGCSNLTSVPLLDTSSGTVFTEFFRDCTTLTTIPAIDTSGGTTFQNFCLGATGLTSIPNIDVGLGENFAGAWSGCTGLDAYDFPTLNMDSMTNGSNCFNGVTLSTTSWSDLLVYIEANNVDTDCVFSGGDSLHNASGATAISALTGRTPGWTITDGGLA